ncbi:MAG TPA: S-layer homology domain-containing protein [Oscillatoriaceae cyanobacterium]
MLLLSLLAPAPALAQEASLGTFSDVPVDHWAFLTVEELARKYQVMGGFPDHTFRGEESVTRYQLAAALDKIMDRMATQVVQGRPIAQADLSALASLLKDYGIDALEARLDKLEKETAELQSKAAASVGVSGHIGSTWMDDSQDDQPPYLATSLGVSLKGTVKGFDFKADMGGAVPAATVGNKPATAGSGKPPDDVWHFNAADVTTTLDGFTIRSGYFSGGSLFSDGTSLKNPFGGAIVGNGVLGPNANPVRWGDRSAALGVSRQIGKVKATASVNNKELMAGVDVQLLDALRVAVSADTDQPDWSDLFDSNKATAQNVYAVADIGSDKLGLSLQGGLSRSLLQGSAQVDWNPFGDVRLGVGAVLRTSGQQVTEVTPGVAFFWPQKGLLFPSLLLAAKEPETVAAATGNTGPGSLLGSLAGVTVTAAWKLEDVGYPNVKLEYDIQQDVLFDDYYEATFAMDVGRGF